jgi:hypothetical protein
MPVSPPFPKGLKMKVWFCGNSVECFQGGSIGKQSIRVKESLTASKKVIKLRSSSATASPSMLSGGQLLISEFCKPLLFYAEEMGDLMHHGQLDLLLQLLQGFTCFLQRFLEKQNAVGE